MRNERGVVLVYVMVLMAMLGYVAAMLLNATMSRRVSAQNAMDSNETRADMATVNGMISSALTQYNVLNPGAPWPTTSCSLATGAGPSVKAYLDSQLVPQTLSQPSDLVQRFYTYQICSGPPLRPLAPPCRIVVNICRRGPDDSPTATCPQPPGC